MKVQDFGDVHMTNNPAIDTATIVKLRGLIEPDTELVIFNGDTHHTFDIGVTNEIFYMFIGKLTARGIRVILVAGNHDISKGRLSFKPIKHVNKMVKIVSEYDFEYNSTIHTFFVSFNYFILHIFRNIPSIHYLFP